MGVVAASCSHEFLLFGPKGKVILHHSELWPAKHSNLHTKLTETALLCRCKAMHVAPGPRCRLVSRIDLLTPKVLAPYYIPL